MNKTFSVDGSEPSTKNDIIKANTHDYTESEILELIAPIDLLEVGDTWEAGGASGSVITRIS